MRTPPSDWILLRRSSRAHRSSITGSISLCMTMGLIRSSSSSSLLLLWTATCLVPHLTTTAQEDSNRLFGTNDGRTRCRQRGRGPHMNGLWQNGFPDGGNDDPVPLCEGTVTMGSDFSVCTQGRVSYDQIAAVTEAAGRYIRAPAATDITVPGHLISGSGNVVLGSEAFLLYDFVANYTIGGVTYEAEGASMTDNLLAASRGLVEAVCFLPTLSQAESYYTISHDFWFPSSSRIDFDRLATANIFYVGYISAVAEYHRPGDAPAFISGHTQLFLITLVASIVPSFAFNLVPFLGLTGIFRLFTRGTMSTARFPQPLDAPPVTVEDVQINTEWTTLLAAAQNGLFLDGIQRVPTYFGVFIKRIQPSSTGNACGWNVETAAIDLQAPQGWGDRLDVYVNDVVLPALQAAGGTIDLHLGKRLQGGSTIMQTALNRYSTECGVALNLSPTDCFHPACRRNGQVGDFTYPAELYA